MGGGGEGSKDEPRAIGRFTQVLNAASFHLVEEKNNSDKKNLANWLLTSPNQKRNFVGKKAKANLSRVRDKLEIWD